MRLYKGTPVYFGEAAVCQRRDEGIFGWIARLLGFPKTPCYQPADPSDGGIPCPGQPPPVD